MDQAAFWKATLYQLTLVQKVSSFPPKTVVFHSSVHNFTADFGVGGFAIFGFLSYQERCQQ